MSLNSVLKHLQVVAALIHVKNWHKRNRLKPCVESVNGTEVAIGQGARR